MTFWDFVWNFWDGDGWLFIITIIGLIVFFKVYDALKTYFLFKRVPDKEKQEQMIKTFDELTKANNHARHEIEKLYYGVTETKTLLQELNEDINTLHEKIHTSKKILKQKKTKNVIEKDDIQEVINILNR